MERFEESNVPAFFAEHVIAAIKKSYPRLAPREVQRYLNRRGYKALIRKDGRKTTENKRARDMGIRMTLWARDSQYDDLMKLPAEKIGKYVWAASHVDAGN